MEVQEGKNAMRENEYAAEHGVSTARVLRMAEDASDEGMTLLGDAWFGSVKVREALQNLHLSCVMSFLLWDRH